MEVGTNTKEKIIMVSLTLFSQKGYEGVSMRDIAADVGIKGASIYNHFKGKEEIFNAIIAKMSTRYDNVAMSIHMPSGDEDIIAEFYSNITIDRLFEIASGMFTFFILDDFASKFRRMLTMEQYRNELAKNTLKKYFFDMPIQFQSQLFTKLIKKGVFHLYDSYIMALHFYAPIYLLLNEYDEESNLERTLQLLKDHVCQFAKLYTKK